MPDSAVVARPKDGFGPSRRLPAYIALGIVTPSPDFRSPDFCPPGARCWPARRSHAGVPRERHAKLATDRLRRRLAQLCCGHDARAGSHPHPRGVWIRDEHPGRRACPRNGAAHLDTDNFFWLPTNPPFTAQRPINDRLPVLASELGSQASWVLTGSLVGWGDNLIPRFTLVVFLYVPSEIRRKRILSRERERYGADIEPGGRTHANHVAFIDWATRYDHADFAGRSLIQHRAWLERLACPIVEIAGMPTVEESVRHVRAAAGETLHSHG